MPRRKKLPTIPDYAGSGREPENHLIQKSNPLLSLSQTDMTLPELKILDIYLSRIDSHDEEKRTVQLEKGEIEDCLGLSRILKPDLEKRLRNLAQMVKIEDETNPDGFILVSLFEKIGAWRDEDGLWQIRAYPKIIFLNEDSWHSFPNDTDTTIFQTCFTLFLYFGIGS